MLINCRCSGKLHDAENHLKVCDQKPNGTSGSSCTDDRRMNFGFRAALTKTMDLSAGGISIKNDMQLK